MPPQKQSTSVELDIPDSEQGIDTVDIDVFGEKITVLKATNFFSLMRVFDPDEPHQVTRYLIDSIAERDRKRFITLMGSRHNLSTEELFEIFSDVLEAQGEGRPTKSSSASPNGSRRRAGSTRSGDTSSPTD